MFAIIPFNIFVYKLYFTSNKMEPPTVVIDNGTGYSKMGYAGNVDPSYIIPSKIAYPLNKVRKTFQ